MNITGYISKCPCGCGAIMGAIDARRTENEVTSRMISEWLGEGRQVIPMTGGTWSVDLSACLGFEERESRKAWESAMETLEAAAAAAGMCDQDFLIAGLTGIAALAEMKKHGAILLHDENAKR